MIPIGRAAWVLGFVSSDERFAPRMCRRICTQQTMENILKVKTILVTEGGNATPTMIDDDATAVVVIGDTGVRVFNYLPGQRYHTGEPIFTEGKAFVVTDETALSRLKD